MRRPSALQLVAWLFFASGAWAAISIVTAVLFERHISLDFEVLGLWIGPGLLRRQARYRTWALRLLIVGFCLTPVAVMLLLVQRGALDVKFLGRPLGTIPVPVALAVLALLVGVSIWQYWVLRRPNVRALFTEPSAEHPEASI
jgi:sterol desaturase/sphingolipid hydroxylase (fatty acid hydroxylase superfamily)